MVYPPTQIRTNDYLFKSHVNSNCYSSMVIRNTGKLYPFTGSLTVCQMGRPNTRWLNFNLTIEH